MKKIKYEDFDYYSLAELREIVKQLYKEYKQQEKIIQELEYRIEALGIKISKNFVDIDEPYRIEKLKIRKQHIPAFDYFECFSED